MRRLSIVGIGLVALAIAFRATPLIAQGELPTDSLLSHPLCAQQFQDALSQQQRILRQVWFGRHQAKTEGLNSVRYDENGHAWIKVRRNTWRTAAKGLEGRTWSDAQIDENTEWAGMNEDEPTEDRDHRTGIFEQRSMLTSELIPDLVTSDRAFTCRVVAVCEAVRRSFLRQKTDQQGFLHIETPGCGELLMKPLNECRFGNADGPYEDIIHVECEPLTAQLVQRERAFLRVAAAYDAAYRSLLQLGGNIDVLLRGLRGGVLAPMEQTLSLLSRLSRIPCFSSQCNE